MGDTGDTAYLLDTLGTWLQSGHLPRLALVRFPS